ncbi:MAG TPA: PEP-CTERM sorting domain-containing protein [Tepidisphaeraceae bacterium]|nr:PEP-CTERM sorting domain-containing protein [Tepidisphaeraceae bacterium]
MRCSIPALFASALLAFLAIPTVSHAALAKQAGKAGTSSTTSSTPQAKAQANLMDPDAADPAGTPLAITFARLDIDIHYDNLPPTLEAFNIIRSITVTPFVNDAGQDPTQGPYAFEAADEMPAYDFDTSTQTSNVTITGPDVFLHSIAVQSIGTPPPGDVILAKVDVQYFNFDSFGGTNYNDIIATFTTTVDESDDDFPQSEIDAVDSFGNVSTFTGLFDPQNNPDGQIIPSSSIQTLGGVSIPEPGTFGSLAALAILAMGKRRRASA